MAAAQAIGPLLPAGAMLVSSDEPKAYDTLTAAAPGRRIRADPRLREVARPLEPFDDDFRVARLAYVEGDPPAGWEPPTQVAARIDAAVTDHRVDDRPLVLAGHGMAFTTWLAAHGLIDDAPAFWLDLGFPDIFLVGRRGIRRLTASSVSCPATHRVGQETLTCR